MVGIQSDSRRENHYYARVRDYLEFDKPVFFREDDHYYESKLRKADGSPNLGRFRRAVRPLTDDEYHFILTAGFEESSTDRAQYHTVLGDLSPNEQLARERPFVKQISRRRFRDRVFAAGVKRAYDDTCAITGLRIINGQGRAEAQAAHIRPVKYDGPDSVRNGLALSATFHWMFDRGLIGIDDDYTLLLKKVSIPESALGLINVERRLRLPAHSRDYPHPSFLRFHRKQVFKG
jgi:putative restriction endonuclease